MAILNRLFILWKLPTKQIAQRSNSKGINTRNWSKYDEELVIPCQLYFDPDFRPRWNDELKKLNNGKAGAPYKFPTALVELMLILHRYIDCRGLERKLAVYGLIAGFSDYTTLWSRIDKLQA